MTASADDPLLRHRDEFPALADSIYLVSHSLGAMPRAAQAALAEFAHLWTEEGINAWSRWLPMVTESGDRIARSNPRQVARLELRRSEQRDRRAAEALHGEGEVGEPVAER